MKKHKNINIFRSSLSAVTALLLVLSLTGCIALTDESGIPDIKHETSQSVSITSIPDGGTSTENEVSQSESSDTDSDAEESEEPQDKSDAEESQPDDSEDISEIGSDDGQDDAQPSGGVGEAYDILSNLPVYDGSTFEVINGNIPYFTESELDVRGYELYSPLDSLGRCGAALASVGTDTMPAEDEKRGSISSIKPSGWVQARYDFVDGEALYNRSHLIGWQLSAENANKLNLVTGTRYMNAEGMLPFENMVADYIKETGNHVAYRVTPIFVGSELVCRGVQMEAYSVEDGGEGICFNVYCFNVQPGVTIDYATGASYADGGSDSGETANYVLNTNTKKIHLPDCKSVKDIKDSNRQDFRGSIEDLLDEGYTRCGNCLG